MPRLAISARRTRPWCGSVCQILKMISVPHFGKIMVVWLGRDLGVYGVQAAEVPSGTYADVVGLPTSHVQSRKYLLPAFMLTFQLLT